MMLAYWASEIGRHANNRQRFATIVAEFNARPMNYVTPRLRAQTVKGPIIVLVREPRAAGLLSPYQFQEVLALRAPNLGNAAEIAMVLLVDRIEVNVRSYRPVGEDFQTVLHCILLNRRTYVIADEFNVRGTVPHRRDGLLTLFGMWNQHGSEPWQLVNRHLTDGFGAR